jgi:N-sulfoglucosamine sulfohydrolase
MKSNMQTQLSLLFALLAVITPSAPGAKPPARPNILFCIADDASYPYLGVYGCSWVKTPGFDRVAREGLLFQRAYTPNAKCAPSRACILTGRNSWQLEAAANHVPYFPAKFTSYVEALSDHGYFVGKTGKGWAPGVEGTRRGQRRHLAGTPFERRKAAPPTRGISGNDYAANFRDFLEAKPPGKPWCFWYGAFEPHRGYEYGSGAAKGGKRISDVDRVPAIWPDNETVRNDLLDYAFELEHFDRHLVKMLALLEEHGELDNTLVVVTADNGMPFPRIKGQEYEMSNHLPLAIMWKNGIQHPGRVIDDYVSFIDFAPTFIEVAGLAWTETGMEPSPGRSLTDLFNAGKSGRINPARDHVLIGKERHDVGRPHDWGYPIRGIVKEGMLYLHNFETNRWPAGNPETGYLNCDGSPTKTVVLQTRTSALQAHFWRESFGKRGPDELYQIEVDPDCLNNLAVKPAYREQAQALQEQLYRELKDQNDPRLFGQGHIFDEYPYANPGQRGFYERFMKGEKLKAGWVNKTDFESSPIEE